MNKFGYRSVWYDSRKKIMRLWTWDDNGNRIEKVEPFNPYLYIETSTTGDAVSIFGTNLKKITFPSQFERRRYVKECGVRRLFGNMKAEQQFLIEKYLGLNETLEFSEQPLRVCPLDIEVDTHIHLNDKIIKVRNITESETTLGEFRHKKDRDGYEVFDIFKNKWISYKDSSYSEQEFPDPTLAKYPINLLTFFDSIAQQYHTFGLKPYTPKLPNVTYYHCTSESNLLKRFLDIWSNDYPDVITGWNSDGFDIPYIINRITSILGEDEARRLSPVGSIYFKADIGQKFGKTVGRWVIHGLNCVDYLELYQTFSRDKRESYKLDFISKVELNEGKIEINATSLAALSISDWNKYVDYNIQDVGLLIRLEEKLRFLKTMRVISHKGFCNLEATMGKVAVVSGAIAAQALKRNQILCTFENEDMGEYAGGFVKEIEPCLKEGVITFDANSLYPNTMITLNISPETKIGKVISTDKEKNEVEIKLVNGKIHTLTRENFLSFLEKEKVSISKAKVLFSQKTKGIVPEYVDELYAERVRNKKAMEVVEKSLAHCKKGTDKYVENKRKMEQLDILQYTLKILLNSIYGVFANKYGPLYDIDCAGSITNTGQAVIKEASNILDQYALEKYGIKEPITHYGDTDSCHITLKPILDILNQPLLDDRGLIAPNVYVIANEINTILNAKINEWSANTLYSTDSRFYFKREAICSTCLYQAKKRYILHIKDKGEKDPVPCDKIKPVGMELAKSTMSETIKSMIKEVLVALLNTKNRDKTLEAYRGIYEKFKTLSPAEIAFRSGINTFSKYSTQATGFAKAKRTPVAVAGAIYYNNLIDVLKLTSKYEKLKTGDRVRWVYCLPNNQYNIHNIAFMNDIPNEFVDIQPDYDKMFKTIIEPAITRLFECAHWKMADLQAEYTVDLLDFFKE